MRLLLAHGADPARRESFFDSSPLDQALWGSHVRIAILLLAAGAPDRATALELALEKGLPELARAAVASGPILESEQTQLAERHPDLSEELAQLLAEVVTRPDPPPPAYGPAQLESFIGRFEGWESGVEAALSVRESGLSLAVDDSAPVRLVAVGERAFRAEEGLTVRFFGRAGLVEGLSLQREGQPALTLRRSVAEPLVRPARDRPTTPEPAASGLTLHWPSFRGRNGAGVGDGLETLVDWDLESGEGVRWQVDLPGLANSSPVVWGDRVFLTTAVGGSLGIRTG